MKSMRLSKSARKHDMPCCVSSKDSGPAYPYGLRIHLDNEQIDTLNLPNLMAGNKVYVTAIASVSEATERSEIVDGKPKPRRNVELQIEDMEIVAVDTKTKAVAASKAYAGPMNLARRAKR